MKKNNLKTKPKYRTSMDIMLQNKAKKVIEAEKKFWETRCKIEKQQIKYAQIYDLEVKKTIQVELSSVVWCLKDGVVFVKYYNDGKINFEIKSADLLVFDWFKRGPFVPTKKGEISLSAKTKATFDCHYDISWGGIIIGNEKVIEHLRIRNVLYENRDLSDKTQSTIQDFELTLIGLIYKSKTEEVNNAQNVLIKNLEKISTDFENLLSNADKEEELQVYLKQHPILLEPTAQIIPKQKLGDDFITDFIIICQNEIGPKYVFVEIEKASHKVFNKNLELSKETNHAIKQTQDWQCWLEKDKAYLQNRLPDFETPQYLIIIGRGNTLTPEEKERLRSINRSSIHTEILTYDDLRIRFNELIVKLKSIQKIEIKSIN